MRNCLLLFLTGGLLAQSAEPFQSAVPAAGAVEYGKYLTEHVANCSTCHASSLKGVGTPNPSPDLTSSGQLFSRWGERGLVRFLETGVDPQGRAAPSHMPAFKLRPHDAQAIVAYLKSLR